MSIHSFRQWLVFLTCACFLVLLSPARGHAADYRLQPGDVLSIQIIGPVEMGQLVPIEIDGTAWFPIIGEVPAADTTLKELRRRVADAYSVTSFPNTTGTESVPQLILSSQVYLAIASYRPILMVGELGQPGIIEFEPGLTLKRAIILAGIGRGTETTTPPVWEREAAVKLNMARVLARIWSLKTLLGTDTTADYEAIFINDNEAVRQIVALEQSLIAARTEDLQRQKSTIAANIHRAEVRLEALNRLRANEAEGLRLDEVAVSDLRALATKGLAVTSRLAEARRAAVTSAGSVLQVEATIEQVRTELSALKADAEAVEMGANSQSWSELSAAIGEVHELQADLASLQADRTATTFVRTPIAAVITRRGVRLDPIDLTAPGDHNLYPGDLVEILSARPLDPSMSDYPDNFTEEEKAG